LNAKLNHLNISEYILLRPFMCQHVGTSHGFGPGTGHLNSSTSFM